MSNAMHLALETVNSELEGRYIAQSRIGGGPGTGVFVVQNALSGTILVLKAVSRMAPPRIINSLDLEARALSRLARSGARVPRAYQYFDTEHLKCLVMEQIEGTRLDALLRHGAILEEARSLEIAKQIAETLDILHEHEIIHQDLKPANILLKKADGTPVLIDFGIAQISGEDGSGGFEGVLGSQEYLAPERIQKSGKSGKMSDYYSLGIVLFEMLTGERPFTIEKHGGLEGLYEATLYSDPPSPRALNGKISGGTTNLVLRLLDKSPEKRPASIATTESGGRGDPLPFSGRSPWIWGVTGLVLLFAYYVTLFRKVILSPLYNPNSPATMLLTLLALGFPLVGAVFIGLAIMNHKKEGDSDR